MAISVSKTILPWSPGRATAGGSVMDLRHSTAFFRMGGRVMNGERKWKDLHKIQQLEVIRPLHCDDLDVSVDDFLDMVDLQIMRPVDEATFDLCELINEIPGDWERRKADACICILMASHTLWKTTSDLFSDYMRNHKKPKTGEGESGEARGIKAVK